jgi:oligopeptide transport system ATP-binding protein
MAMTLLAVRNLKTQFVSRSSVVKAVDGIDLDVNEGEIVALVGESGSGKSVTALSLMRLVPSPPGKIVDGEAMFEGQDLLKLDDAGIRRVRGSKIAMIFQEPMSSLNPVLTIGRQLTEPLEIHLGLKPKDSEKRASEYLERVGITDVERRLKQYPHELSGGMRQRVMIAMAMSCGPKLLLADEPTTALDVTIQAQILELIRNVCRDLNVAVVLITHNLGVVARYADTVNIMYAGRIVEHGPADEVYKNPAHPYTAALLRSVPRLDAERREGLETIDGHPPLLGQLPTGCAFHPRCQLASGVCAERTPTSMEVGRKQFAACWNTPATAEGRS